MQPDSQRQWFVYFKEKEIGPISEKELHAKIKAGDLDASAYVFTEGMSDWALVSDTPVLAAPPAEELKGFSDESAQARSKVSSVSQAQQSAVHQPAKSPTQSPTQSGVREASQFKNVVTSTKSVVIKSPKVDLTKSVAVGVPSKAKSAGLAKVDLKDAGQRKRLLVLLLLGAVTVVAGGVLSGTLVIPGMKEMAGPVDTGKEPLPNKAPPNKPQLVDQKSPPTTPQTPASPESKSTVPATNDWESALQQFRAIKDPKGSVSMIARASMGSKFPIFVGSLSPLLNDIKDLVAAVYPDNDKNMMVLPRLWYFRVPVQEGWFTIGPLSNAGSPLPPGRYVITLMSQGKAFDDQVIDVGTWPSEPELAKIQTQLAQERAQAANKEKSDLAPRLKAAVALEKQLLVRSVDARKQKKGRSAWTSFSKAWYKDCETELKAASSLASGPTFYADAQRKLATYLEALRGLYETYEMISKEGPKALKKAGRKSEEQQRLFITRLNTDLNGLVMTLKAPEKIEAFKLNPNVVKETLRTFEQSAKELTQ